MLVRMAHLDHGVNHGGHRDEIVKLSGNLRENLRVLRGNF